MTDSAISWLADLDAAAVDRAGGKGANLGELVRAGLPVPPGFVITIDGYAAFVEANGLQAPIVDLATQARPDEASSVQSASARIRALFERGSMPDRLAAAIHAALADLVSGDPEQPVAIRSSATAEDLPTASFAGQQDSYLNVRGERAVLEAVQRCWASLWTARAMAYRLRQGIDSVDVRLAVVVQQLIPADSAGVLFTANPVDGDRDQIVINATWGLGEALVGGQVTPDTVVVAKPDLRIASRDTATKPVMTVRTEDGTRAQPVPRTQQDAEVVDDATALELARYGIAIEQQFGAPQDVEWAVADGTIWLLQSRPITHLPPAPLRNVRWEPPRPGTVWMRRQVVEHMPEPLSALFDELYLTDGLTESMTRVFALMAELAGVDDRLAELVPKPFAITVNGYAYSAASFNGSWRVIWPVLRIYATLPKFIGRFLGHWRDDGLPGYRSLIETWTNVDPDQTSDEDLLAGVRALATADAIYWFDAAVPLGLARITDAVLDRFLKVVAGSAPASGGARPSSGAYLRGFPTKAIQAQQQLEDMARAIRGSDVLSELMRSTPAKEVLPRLTGDPAGQPVLDGIERYLANYGHEIYNLDFVAPTLADDPLPMLLSLKSAVEHPDQDAYAHQQQLVRERDTLIRRTEASLHPLNRRLFRLLLRWAQQCAPARDEALFYVGAAWPVLRRLALELGQRLADAGSLNDPDDVFFLHTAELTKACAARADGSGRPELARLARERRELREARKRLDPPVSVPSGGQLKFGPIRLTMFEPLPADISDGPTLSGFAVSPGTVTATASLVRSPADFDQMLPGTVLVCPTTTPAWTPLFSQAAGLVTDIGGALAHGSIVAREYGIPAVMGTSQATRRIRSGDRLQVDGDTGTVTLLDEAFAEPAAPGSTTTDRGLGLRRAAEIAALATATIGVAVWWLRRRQ
ncbi:MAG: phosphoenolpyruvate synthase [Microlunatus sp.]|nr:phosphoenolpyruvate synthase [Microlunatus sp.]